MFNTYSISVTTSLPTCITSYYYLTLSNYCRLGKEIRFGRQFKYYIYVTLSLSFSFTRFLSLSNADRSVSVLHFIDKRENKSKSIVEHFVRP